MSAERYLTKQQVADELGVSTRTVTRYRLPHLKVGGQNRYKLSEVQAFLREQQRQESMDSWRNRLAHRLANFALGRIATERYRDMIAGSILYGLRAAARDSLAQEDPSGDSAVDAERPREGQGGSR